MYLYLIYIYIRGPVLEWADPFRWYFFITKTLRRTIKIGLNAWNKLHVCYHQCSWGAKCFFPGYFQTVLKQIIKDKMCLNGKISPSRQRYYNKKNLKKKISCKMGSNHQTWPSGYLTRLLYFVFISFRFTIARASLFFF